MITVSSSLIKKHCGASTMYVPGAVLSDKIVKKKKSVIWKLVSLHHSVRSFSSKKLNVTLKAHSYSHSDGDERKQNKKRSGVGVYWPM